MKPAQAAAKLIDPPLPRPGGEAMAGWAAKLRARPRKPRTSVGPSKSQVKAARTARALQRARQIIALKDAKRDRDHYRVLLQQAFDKLLAAETRIDAILRERLLEELPAIMTPPDEQQQPDDLQPDMGEQERERFEEFLALLNQQDPEQEQE